MGQQFHTWGKKVTPSPAAVFEATKTILESHKNEIRAKP